MSNIKKFADFVNENLNEAELPSWVEGGPYDSLKDMTGNIDLVVIKGRISYILPLITTRS